MKICLCGSTRFLDQFALANRRLTLAGHLVYSVATATTGDHPELTMDEKIALDAVHLSKIEESDAVMIVGQQEDGSMYIGDSTRREIMFARIRDKPVYFFDPTMEQGGAVKEFENDLRAAYETTAMRNARAEEERARQQAFMERFQRAGGAVPVSYDEDEIDHSGDPEASKSEETH